MPTFLLTIPFYAKHAYDADERQQIASLLFRMMQNVWGRRYLYIMLPFAFVKQAT